MKCSAVKIQAQVWFWKVELFRNKIALLCETLRGRGDIKIIIMINKQRFVYRQKFWLFSCQVECLVIFCKKYITHFYVMKSVKMNIKSSSMVNLHLFLFLPNNQRKEQINHNTAYFSPMVPIFSLKLKTLKNTLQAMPKILQLTFGQRKFRPEKSVRN